MIETINNKINFELLKKVYKGLAFFYIDTINYNSINDVKPLLNNQYYNQNKFYRQKVFNLIDVYFENNQAKIVFNKIIKYCYLKKINDPDITLEECITDWKKKYLDKYIAISEKQSLDEDYRFFNRIKKHFAWLST